MTLLLFGATMAGMGLARGLRRSGGRWARGARWRAACDRPDAQRRLDEDEGVQGADVGSRETACPGPRSGSGRADV